MHRTIEPSNTSVLRQTAVSSRLNLAQSGGAQLADLDEGNAPRPLVAGLHHAVVHQLLHVLPRFNLL